MYDAQSESKEIVGGQFESRVLLPCCDDSQPELLGLLGPGSVCTASTTVLAEGDARCYQCVTTYVRLPQRLKMQRKPNKTRGAEMEDVC